MRVYTNEAVNALAKTGRFEDSMERLMEGAQHYADRISSAIIMPRPDLMLAAVALSNMLDMVMKSLDKEETAAFETMKNMLGVEAVTMEIPLRVKGDGSDD